jgi:hypothetical protein
MFLFPDEHDDIQRQVGHFRAKLRKYRLTEDQYFGMLNAQHGLCAVCGQPETHSTWALAIDHDHATGRVRGLLCFQCNTMIGKAKDNPAILRAGADYVERHKALNA